MRAQGEVQLEKSFVDRLRGERGPRFGKLETKRREFRGSEDHDTRAAPRDPCAGLDGLAEIIETSCREPALRELPLQEGVCASDVRRHRCRRDEDGGVRMIRVE